MKKILPIFLFTSFLLGNTKTVAVSYFDNTSGLEEYNPLSKGLADMLITDLSNVKSIQIVEREKLESLLKEIELGDTKFMDESTAQKLGKGLGAGYILTGSFLIMDETMRIDARLVDVGTGKITMAEGITGGKNTFFKLEKELVNQLVASLNLGLSKSEERRIKKVQTESFESFTAYSTSLDAQDRGQYEEAKQFLEKAVEIDKEFDIAWDKLDEIEKYLKELIQMQSLGFEFFFIDLINSLDFDDPVSCNQFNNKIWFKIHPKTIYPGLYLTYLVNASKGAQYDSKWLAESTEKDWVSAGYTHKLTDKEECVVEYAKIKSQLFNFIDHIVFGDFPDKECGTINPKEALLNQAMYELHRLREVYIETKIAIDKNGRVIQNKVDSYYDRLFIEYGTLLYKKFPETIYTHHLTFLQEALDREKGK